MVHNRLINHRMAWLKAITLFRSIIVLCGTESIPQNIPILGLNMGNESIPQNIPILGLNMGNIPHNTVMDLNNVMAAE